MTELAIRVQGTRSFIHRSPQDNREPVGKNVGAHYLTLNPTEARRFSTLSSAESYARRLKLPYKQNGLDRSILEIVEVEWVIGGVKLRV